MPLAEFLTTAHDHLNITKYLNSIKNKIIQYSNLNSNIFPKIIVIDMSWALCNSVLLAFNNCTIQIYLNWCFDILTKEINDISYKKLMAIKIYFCSTHVLKNIIKKAKSITKSNQIKNLFIFCFCLIQNSLNIDQILFYLFHVHNIFNNKNLDDSVIISINLINKEIMTKKMPTIEILESDTNAERERNSSFEYLLNQSKDLIFLDKSFDQNLKNSSPFSIYFKEKIRIMEFELNSRANLNNIEKLSSNEFYCPLVFSLISDFLYLTPLWTAIMIGNDINKHKFNTRLSNNPVENWFDQLKNKIINRKRVSTSEMVTPIFKRILSKYIKHYYIYEEKTSNLSDILKLFNLDQNNIKNKLFNEIWVDKKQKRRKGFYYENIDLLKNFYFKNNYEIDNQLK